jgi:hypothetical protein
MVVVTSFADQYALKISEAQAAVAEAQLAHSRGGSVDKLNAANSKLARAHCEYTEWVSGRVPDDR